MRFKFRQGQVVKTNLNPTRGHEQKGMRPVLIISNNEYNRLTGLVKVVPITTKLKDFPMHLDLPENLDVEGQVLLEHERTLDLVSRGFELIDEVPKEFLDKVLSIIKMTY
ncbi:type II toxin-antitoxin system PemK/MazF family toxin [Ligilactobacillus faecis]|uniref:type II toxin-antitoxin system PemK/MazF family toxin n=1 Tax=Ligilactobacillus faecis TaxID=762833 RepID=UPI00246848E6|nr:type II toxin-antitoxin system PemK/MazF family toxin [Ligilactobacillus faecis]WGN89784.1 type II toxin-antitoxin system PemK/MazF family toxin [Ligilactobacillus faecis]